MSWQHALLALFGVSMIFSAAVIVGAEILERRRARKHFRINPMYRVGEDAK